MFSEDWMFCTQIVLVALTYDTIFEQQLAISTQNVMAWEILAKRKENSHLHFGPDV